MEKAQETLRRKARITLDTMQDKLKELQVPVDSQYEILSELIKMIEAKSKSNPEILEFAEQVTKALQYNETFSDILKSVTKVAECLKASMEGLIDKVTVLENGVDGLKTKIEETRRKRVSITG